MPGSFYKETAILLRTIRGKKVVFLSHARPDWDTLASAYALTHFFSGKAQTTFGLCEEPNPEHQNFFSHFSGKEVVIQRLSDFDIVACVDFRSPLMCGNLAPLFSRYNGKVVLLDHHSLSTHEFPNQPLHLLRPSSIATAQMVTQMGMELNADFTKPVSTALAVAIIADSARFSVANTETFGVMDFLVKKSNKKYEDLADLAFPAHSLSTRVSVLKSLRSTEFFQVGDYLVAVSHSPYHGGLSSTYLVQLGADIGLSLFRSPEGIFSSIRVSSRAHGKLKFDAMKVLLPFAKKNNAVCGGHGQAAQLNVPPYFSESLVIDLITRALLERVRKKDKKAVLRKR